MIAYLLILGSSEIENITVNKQLYLLNTKIPEEAGWLDAWKKYEFIHKFRLNYRHRGLVQGSPLSPMLTVLTLIVLDELEDYDIKYILYCDDGLMYSDKPLDLMEIAQDILDRNEIGAVFSVPKCK